VQVEDTTAARFLRRYHGREPLLLYHWYYTVRIMNIRFLVAAQLILVVYVYHDSAGACLPLSSEEKLKFCCTSTQLTTFESTWSSSYAPPGEVGGVFSFKFTTYLH
jgi:hypothetical protein